MERGQFTFYRSYYDALKMLPAKERERLVMAICGYALDEKAPALTGAAASLFILIKPTLDTGRRKAENRKNKEKMKLEQERTNEEQNDNKQEQTDKEKDKELDKELEKDIFSIKEESNDSSCAEPENPASALQVITLTLNDGSEYPIYDTQVQQWGELYPAVDVMQQLRAMRGWLDANPQNRKTKKGILRFVNAWLGKKQDRAQTVTKPPTQEGWRMFDEG